MPELGKALQMRGLELKRGRAPYWDPVYHRELASFGYPLFFPATRNPLRSFGRGQPGTFCDFGSRFIFGKSWVCAHQAGQAEQSSCAC